MKSIALLSPGRHATPLPRWKIPRALRAPAIPPPSQEVNLNGCRGLSSKALRAGLLGLQHLAGLEYGP